MTAEWITRIPPHLPVQTSYRVLLTRITDYLNGPWWSAKGYVQQGPPTLNLSTVDNAREYAVRGAGMAALAMAARWLAYGDPLSGQRAAQLSLACAYSHKATMSGGWGGDWQAGYWAALAGLAGLLVWPANVLTDTGREALAKMVYSEANRIAVIDPPVWRNASGQELTPGDSKHEENAWNSCVLALAAAAMPTHPNAALWKRMAVAYVMCGNAHPTDAANPTVVNGRAVSSWTAAGSNVQNNYTVVNHNIVHPDYMQTVVLGLHSALTFTLFDHPAPAGLAWNAGRIYNALQTPLYSGTAMYQSNGLIYYPQGGDWGTRRPAGYAALDTAMHVMELDADSIAPATYWEALHVADAAAQQMRAVTTDRPSGVLVTTTTPNPEDVYRSRVEWQAGHFGLATLLYWARDRIQWTDESVVD
jgi:hypothetical protein